MKTVQRRAFSMCQYVGVSRAAVLALERTFTWKAIGDQKPKTGWIQGLQARRTPALNSVAKLTSTAFYIKANRSTL